METKVISLNGDTFRFECERINWHSRGFAHVCTLFRNGHEMCSERAEYLNRTWEAYPYQTVMLMCTKKVADNTELIIKLK